MCRGQDIKEAAAWIGDEKNALTREYTPSKSLTCQKQDAQPRSYAPPPLESGPLILMQMAPSNLNSNAAGQKNQRIQPEDAWKIERDPVISQALAHQKRAGQGHEEHDDSGESELNHREVGSLRYTWGAAGAFSVVVSARGNVIAAAATGVNYLDFIRDRTRHNRTPLVCLAHPLRRNVLRNVIVRRPRNAEFIRPAIDHRNVAGKIIERGRRGNAPFQSRGVPRIVGRFLPRLHTVEKVE